MGEFLDGVLGQDALALGQGVIIGAVNWTGEELTQTFRLGAGEIGRTNPSVVGCFKVGGRSSKVRGRRAILEAEFEVTKFIGKGSPGICLEILGTSDEGVVEGLEARKKEATKEEEELKFLRKGLAGPGELSSQSADPGGEFVNRFMGPLGQGRPLKEEGDEGGRGCRFVSLKNMV